MAKGDRGGKKGGGGDLLGKEGNTGKILETKDLISLRGTKQAEVDEVLTTARRMNNLFGEEGIVNQLQVAKMKGGMAMAYYDDGGNIAVNQRFFSNKGMDAAMDRAIKDGFHPSRGNKSGMEATVAHEFGHSLTEKVGQKLGQGGFGNIKKTSREIVERARAKTNHKTNLEFAGKISGYAKYNFSECVAEAVCDWYCNGSKASKESRAVVAVINSILKGGK